MSVFIRSNTVQEMRFTCKEWPFSTLCSPLLPKSKTGIFAYHLCASYKQSVKGIFAKLPKCTDKC